MSGAARMLGRVVANQYTLTSVIGEGGMATVYGGEQEREPREVAVKILHAHLVAERTFLRRFHREAKAAAQIRHPGSVRVLDYGVDGTIAYIVMERLTGKDLFDVLAAERRMSEARAARIMIEVADALSSAHALGIVHRDLKPENVMLSRHPKDPDVERVKVLDFGIAKILDDEAQPPPPPSSGDGPMSSDRNMALTTVGMLVGTPAYMSPEQCLAKDMDGRSDVYAAGVMLYQLVTGRTPFEGDGMLEIGPQHVGSPPPPPSRFAPAITRALEACILQALAKDPEGRQQTAAALGDQLERLLPSLATEPHPPPPSGRTAARQDTPPPVSQRSVVVASPRTLPSPSAAGKALAAEFASRRLDVAKLPALAKPRPMPSPAEAPAKREGGATVAPVTQRRGTGRQVLPLALAAAASAVVAIAVTLIVMALTAR